MVGTDVFFASNIVALLIGLFVGSAIGSPNQNDFESIEKMKQYNQCVNYLPAEKCFERYIRNAK